MRRHVWFVGLVVLLFARNLPAQQPVAWLDPSPHTIQFVTVDKNVKLEVLDWGGSGRPVILLAGLGATAHVFDDFAPKLSGYCHVYGITRRGFGASSVPVSGYSADRLGDDVLAVIDALKTQRPVLVGHSIAGEELSSVGTRHPELVSGLIYLDAAYAYAFYDPARGDFNIDLEELRHVLDNLQSGNGPDRRQSVQVLLQDDLPRFEKDLQRLQDDLSGPNPTWPHPTSADMASFPAAVSWFRSVYGYAMPEAELRQEVAATAEGHVGKGKSDPKVIRAINAGEQKFAEPHTPILALFADPQDQGPFVLNDPAARKAYEARSVATTEAEVAAFEAGVPNARVVRLPRAAHDVFLSNEADVLQRIRDFLGGLDR